MNLTDLLVPTYRNMLRTLSDLLDKAVDQLGADKAEALLSARLAPDMFPLATQLRFACVQAQEAPLRLLWWSKSFARADPHVQSGWSSAGVGEWAMVIGDLAATRCARAA
jgi:hypothetical protein